MGFILQLMSNGSNRLLYMYLIAHLANINSYNAVEHATQLGYAAGMAVFFGLNIYQHNIAHNAYKVQVALDTCSAQYRLLLTLGGALWGICLCLLLCLGSVPTILLAVLSGIALAQTDVTFSMATTCQKIWRPLLYYGSQIFFYTVYLVFVIKGMGVSLTVLCSVFCLFIINLVAYAYLSPQIPGSTKLVGHIRLPAFQERLTTLLGNSPVVLVVPAMIYLMGAIGQPEQIPQLLLFVSFAGAIAFLLSNTYHFYGHQWSPKLLALYKNGDWHLLLSCSAVVFIASFMLSLPVGVLLGCMKKSAIYFWPISWYFCAGILAAGIILTQWYSVICLGISNARSITIGNSVYLACTLILFLGGGMSFIYALMIATIIRFALQAAYLRIPHMMLN